MGYSNAVVFKNMIWRYAERMLAQIITFLVTLILTRLLSPSDYGTVALITVVIAMLEVFSTRGYNQALIQKQEVDQLDYSTICFTNLGINICLYGLVFIAAPIVADFYGNPQLNTMMRVLGVRLIISGFNSIQQAYVQRNMLFKKFFYSTLSGTIISGGVGVIIAFWGGGAWAIIAQSLTNAFIDMSVLFITIDWKPSWKFSKNRLWKLSGFGIKMLAMGLLDSLYDNIRSLVVGKMYTAEDLAYYNKGQSLPNMVITNTQVAASNVFFSALSREKSAESIKKKLRQYLSFMFFLFSPIMIGMACISKDLIILLFSQKWILAAPYVTVYCISYLSWVPQMPILQAMNAYNKSGVTLILSIIHRVIGMIMLFLCIQRGPYYIALSAMTADIIITIFIYIWGSRVFKYRLSEILQDTSKTILSAAIMALTVILLGNIVETYIQRIVLEISMGIVVYAGSSLLLKNNNLEYINKKIKSKIGKKAP